MATKDRITISVERRDGVPVIVVGGEIDLFTGPTFKAAVADALADKPTALIVDLLAVDFLGSIGIEILVAAQQRIGTPGCVAVVANSPATRRPIQLTGLDAALPLYPTLDEAVTALRTDPE